jgi:hypothetical protein
MRASLAWYRGNPLSPLTRSFIASAILAALAGYLVLGSIRQIETPPEPGPGTEGTSRAFVPSTAPSPSETEAFTAETKAAPETTTTPLQPVAPVDIKPTENTASAVLPQTAQTINVPRPGRPASLSGSQASVERTESNLLNADATSPTTGTSTCLPSASAVRQADPEAWPSWTLRAPGHIGTRCWYAGTRAAHHR